MSEGLLFTADEILDLPVADLAIAILNDAQQNSVVSARDWMGRQRRAYTEAYNEKDGPALDRLAEAWQWLYSKGAVARDYLSSNTTAILITSLGESLLADGTDRLIAEERLGVDLHPLLERKVRRLFLFGDYELAVFAAFREVEIRVRLLIGASESQIGVPLMRAAFGPGGKLRAVGDEGELDATANLFAGAIGVFKNPASHREIDISDPIQAVESVLFADLLLRLLDRIAP